ncbi:MAG TPA: PAS domain S-box protein, partial [bacterium]|nr:PAS domain S-box protein [bacterium]
MKLKEKEKQMQEIVNVTLYEIDSFIFERIADLKNLADEFILKNQQDYKSIINVLENARNNFKSYLTISYYNADKIRIADANKIGIGQKNTNFQEWDKILAGEISTGKSVYYSNEFRQNIIEIGVPVKDTKNKIIGAIIGKIPLEKIHNIIKKNLEAYSDVCDAFLLTDDNIILYDSHNNENILKSIKAPSNINAHIEHHEKMFNTNPAFLSTIDYCLFKNRKELVVFKTSSGYLDFSGNNWKFFLELDFDYITAPIIKLQEKLIFIVLLIFIFMIIIGYLFSRAIAKPLEKLVKATEQIKQGNYDFNIPVLSKDETGELTMRFNEMAGVLKSTTVSKKYNDSIINNMADMLIVINENFRINTVNYAFIELLGYSEEELIGAEFSKIYSVNNAENLYDVITKKIIPKNKIVDYIAQYRAKNNEDIPVSISAAVIKDNTDKLTAIVFIARDIRRQLKAEAELKSANQQLLASEQQLKAINQQLLASENNLKKQNIELINKNQELLIKNYALENSLSGIAISNMDGKIFYVNNAFTKLFGFKDKNEALNKTPLDLHPENEHSKIIESLENIKTKGTGRIELTAKKTNGELFSVQISTSLVKDDSGTPICMMAAFEDITQIKQYQQHLKAVNQQLLASEQQLKALNQQLLANEQQLKNALLHVEANEKKYRELIENMREGLIVINSNGIITFVNPAMAEMLGYEPDELINKPVLDFMDSELHEKAKNLIKHEKATKSGLQFEFTFKHKDNTDVDVLMKTLPFIENDKYMGSMATVINISEQKQLQKQLIHSEKLAAVGQLAAGIAHEFNNVLTIIYSNAQLLHYKEYKEKFDEFLNTVEGAVKRGAAIVADIMAFAKPAAPKKELTRIEDIIEEILALQKQQLILENIEIDRHYKHTEKVEIDKGQFQQVFLNLIINARHAILPKSRGKISIYTRVIHHN